MHLQEMTALAGTTCMHLLAFGTSCVQKAPKKRGSAIITAFFKNNLNSSLLLWKETEMESAK